MSDSDFDDFDVFEVASSSPDFRSELAAQLAKLVPEAVADGKIDVTKLQELLADDVADDSERFGLFWPGKKRALRAAQEPTTATLRPDFENSKDWDTTQNVFIEGDNLEVLKIMQKHYHGKIKMIYIDPPYNTGKDFVYPDNYKEGLDSYLEWTRQVNEEGKKLSTNSETEGRYHSNWLNMMYPRLKLARNLLTEDGVIFISIDDHEYDNLKKLLDSLFGEVNFINSFVWVNNLKGRQIRSVGAVGTREFILCYAKQIDAAPEFRASSSELKAAMPTIYKGFNYEVLSDELGQFVLKNELHNTNSAFNEATRPNLVFDIYFDPISGDVKTTELSEEDKFPGLIKIRPKKNNNGTNKYHAFRWSRRKVETESRDLFFQNLNGEWKVYTKVRDVDSTSFKDLVMDIPTNGGSKDISDLGLNSDLFEYPKPVALIELLCSVATLKDSLILDFFAGSGTTAQAVMSLNQKDGGTRKYIQIQLPEPIDGDYPGETAIKTIADISIQRIYAASLKFQNESRVDVDCGFRVFKLSDSNFLKWQSTSDTDGSKLSEHLLELRDTAHDNATADDLLFEILLKQGYSLTEKVNIVTISGLELRSVADGVLLAYLNEHVKPSLEQLRAVVAEAPARLILLEDAFHGDDELKTNLAQLCKSSGIELWTA